jgi:phage terminase large subunit-like protein
MSVKRLYFGIPLGSSISGSTRAWAAVQGKVDPAKLKGRKCWLSLDLSQKNDLTALDCGLARRGRPSLGEDLVLDHEGRTRRSRDRRQCAV